ncbi:MAG: hypothetical protein QM656_11445 [Paracoccaceae bacterium]
MLILGSAFALAGRPGAVLFRDDADPGVLHVMAPDLAVDRTGGREGAQLTVMGRGPRGRDDGILAAFWTLTLAATLTEADRRALAAALTPQGGASPRLLAVEQDLALNVTLTGDPPVAASARVAGWRGGPVVLSGDATGQAAADLARAWAAGLPQAHLHAAFTLRGLGDARTALQEETALAVHLVAPATARMVVSTTSLRQREMRVESAVLRRDAPLRLDRAALRRATTMAGFSD